MNTNALARALRVLPADPGRRIRTALAFHGSRQADLAMAIGTDETALSRKLNGRRAWSSDEQAKAAALLGVPVGLLFPEAA